MLVTQLSTPIKTSTGVFRCVFGCVGVRVCFWVYGSAGVLLAVWECGCALAVWVCYALCGCAGVLTFIVLGGWGYFWGGMLIFRHLWALLIFAHLWTSCAHLTPNYFSNIDKSEKITVHIVKILIGNWGNLI